MIVVISMVKYLLTFCLSTLAFSQIKVGDDAPPVSLFRLDNNKYYHLKDDIGEKSVVFSFFATWCGPCKKEIPKLHEMVDSLATDSISIYLVDVQEKKKVVRPFKEKENIELPILLDKYGVYFEKYGGETLPLTVVIDKKGKISYYHTGYEKGDEVELLKHLRSL